MSFAKEVWSKLSELNVNEKVEKKQNLTYLSWSWAWAEFMKLYPESDYIIHEERYFQDGTCEVGVTITCKEGDKSLARFMWLPVIDHRNKAIISPNSFDVNKNKMRCFVKCLAMFGLGLYIYAGEDLPEERPLTPAEYIDLISKCLNISEISKKLAEAVKNYDFAKDEFVKAATSRKHQLEDIQNDTPTN